MPKGIKKTPIERIATIAAIHKGFTLEQVNTVLIEAGFEPMNENSYNSERSTYVPAIYDSANNYELLEHIHSPRKWDEI